MKTQTPTRFFQGTYVNTIGEVLAASIISGTHAIIISPPGWGKTEMLLAGAEQIADSQRNFTALHPSTPPSVVEGQYDIGAFIKESKYVRVTEGTAFDANNKIVHFDELPRASDVVFDAALHIFDPKGLSNPPTIWSTANFVPTDERTEALRDRIGLWCHVYPVIEDLDASVDARRERKVKMLMPTKLPTWDEVCEVRSWRAGDNAHTAVKEFIRQVVAEISQGKRPYSLNQRHITQWYDIFYRHAAWCHGSPDFTNIPEATKQLVRYAWVQPTKEEWNAWGSATASLADQVGSLIRAQMEYAIAKIVEKQNELKANKVDANAVILFATGVVTTVQQNIKKAGGDDPRVKQALARLQSIVTTVAQGKPIGTDLGL